MKRRPLAYVAHPYGGDPDNRAEAAKWCARLAKQGFAPSATWIVLTGEWAEDEGRELGLECDCAAVERCDVFVMTGPRVSPGMAIERDHAAKHGVPIVSLVGVSIDSDAVDLALDEWATGWQSDEPDWSNES